MNKRKKVLAVMLASSCMALGAATLLAANGFSSRFAVTKADTYSMNLDSANGAAAGEASSKRAFVTAKTANNGDVKMKFKRMSAAEGKIGMLHKGGFYGNDDAISGISKIKVVSSATAGQGKLLYGATSGYLDNEIDLADAGEFDILSNAHFFRIEANADIELTSVEVEFACNFDDEGAIATKEGADVYDSTNFTWADSTTYDGYIFKSTNAGRSAYDKVVVPDFHMGDNGYRPVVEVGGYSDGYGFAEGNSYVEEAHFPENLKAFRQYMFYTPNKIRELTLPYGLEKTMSAPLPKGDSLKVLNIESKNLSSVTDKGIGTGSSYANGLEEINVGSDVEKLPDLIYSWPSTMQRINYDGTTEEWEELSTAAGTSSYWSGDLPDYVDVYCLDTETSTINFHFDGATLNGNEDFLSKSFIVGRNIQDPGIPVYADNAKKFDGWYDAAEGGNPIAFPFEATGDAEIYAHFIDWPAGYSMDNPAFIEKDGSAMISVNSIDGQNKAYFAYNATQDEVIIFDYEFANPGYAYGTKNIKVYDKNKNPVTLPYAYNTAAYDAADIANTGGNFVKIHLKAGETYFFELSLTSSSTYYAADINFSAMAADSDNLLDYTVAANYTVGETVDATPAFNAYQRVWYKFDCDFSGNRKFHYASAAGVYTMFDVVYFDGDGNMQKLNSSTLSSNTAEGLDAYLEFVAGTTYYIAIGTNANGAVGSFCIENEVPAGSSYDNPIDAVAGTQYTVDNLNSTIKGAYYRIHAEAGIMICPKVSISSYSCSKQMQVKVLGSDGEELASAVADIYSSYGSSYKGEATLNYTVEKEGDYIIAAGYADEFYTSSDLHLVIHTYAPGCDYDHAIEINPVLGGVGVAVEASEEGMFYTFTAPTTDNGVLEVAAEGIADAELSIYDGTNYVRNTQKGFVRYQISSGTKVTVCIKGEGAGNLFLRQPSDDGLAAERAIQFNPDELGKMKLANYVTKNSSQTMYLAFNIAEASTYELTSIGEYDSTLAKVFLASDSEQTAIEPVSLESGFRGVYALDAGDYIAQFTMPGSSYADDFGIKIAGHGEEAGTYAVDYNGEEFSLELDGFGNGKVAGTNDTFEYAADSTIVVTVDHALVEPDGVTPRTFTIEIDWAAGTTNVTNVVTGEKQQFALDLNAGTYGFVWSDEGYYQSTNQHVSNSTAVMAIECFVGGNLCFDYFVESEVSSYSDTIYDYMYVKKNGVTVSDNFGGYPGVSGSFECIVNAGDIVTINYYKDGSTDKGIDAAQISNIALDTGGMSNGTYAVDGLDANIILNGFGQGSYKTDSFTYVEGDIITVVVHDVVETGAGLTARTITVDLDVATKTGTIVNIDEETASAFEIDLTTMDAGLTFYKTSHVQPNKPFTDNGDGSYTSSNAGQNSTTAEMTIVCNKAGTLTFKTSGSAESSWDTGAIHKNGTKIKDLVTSSNTFAGDQEIEVAAGDRIQITFSKDGYDAGGVDALTVSDIALA